MSTDNLPFSSNTFSSYRLRVLVYLPLITPLGFASKFYKGPGAAWFNNYAGGFLYEIFWCLVATFFFPKAKALWIALWVLSITCILEFLQLWHPPFLEATRGTFMGRTLIGTTFARWDFFYYVIGCGIGWFWLNRLQRFHSETD